MINTPVKQWRRQKQVASLIGKTGKILNWTIIRVPGKSFAKEAPYPVVIVQLDEGKKMIGQLVDWLPDDLQKGKKVIAVLRRLRTDENTSIISYIIKFRPYDKTN